MKKIIIFYASFGMGHKSAAMALHDHFTKMDIEVSVIDFYQKFLPGFSNIVRFMYDTSIKKIPKAYGAFFTATNDVSSEAITREIDRIGIRGLEAFLSTEMPDAVIATFPISGKIEQIRKKNEFRYFVVITDFGVHRTWVKDYIDMYFVADEKVKKDLAIKGVAENDVSVTGIPVREQFSIKYDTAKARSDLGLSEMFTVLLMGKTRNITKNILPRLCGLNIQIAAVAGRNEGFYNSVKKLALKYGNLIPLRYEENVSRLMQASDLIIGKGGGLTLSEALAAGLPMVIFDPIPGQEFFNVDFLVNEGAALFARDSEDLLQKISFLSGRGDRLLELQKNALRLGRPFSSTAICERILNYMK